MIMKKSLFAILFALFTLTIQADQVTTNVVTTEMHSIDQAVEETPAVLFAR